MKYKLIFSVFLIWVCFSGFSQNKTFIGLSTYINGDLNEISDATNCFNSTSLKNVSIGLNVCHEINTNLILETGIILKKFKIGFQFDAPKIEGSFLTSSNAINAFQIPFRIKLKSKIGRSVSLITSLGYHFCYSNTTGRSKGYYNYVSITDTITINYSSNYNKPQSFSLLESTIGLEFNLIKGCRLLFSGSYYSGFSKIVNMDINYKYNSLPLTFANASSTGNYWSVGVSFYYPIRLFRKPEKTSLF